MGFPIRKNLRELALHFLRNDRHPTTPIDNPLPPKYAVVRPNATSVSGRRLLGYSAAKMLAEAASPPSLTKYSKTKYK
jgi:hypothetical protein